MRDSRNADSATKEQASPSIPARCASVWQALLGTRELNRSGRLASAATVGFAADGARIVADPEAHEALFVRDPTGCWQPAPGLSGEPRAVASLYLPCVTAATEAAHIVGHLGQSLDGYIATAAGDSHYVTGRENILHLHRMRALCDAVVVGAETVTADDPSLTARLAAGDNPVRVILDPNRRLQPLRRVFMDGAAATWVVNAEAATGGADFGAAKIVVVPMTAGELDLARLTELLLAAGLRSIFVEGGGATVSRFLAAGLLDRLQIAIAPLVIGRGRPGLRIDGQRSLADCLRTGGRVFRMGRDILFDCELRGQIADDSADQPWLAAVY